MPERRIASRIKFVAEVEVAFENKIFKGVLLDISLTGALLLIHSNIQIPIEIGNCCVLRFYIPSYDTPLKLYKFNAELVRLHQNRLGFRFLVTERERTMTHLRRLIEYCRQRTKLV